MSLFTKKKIVSVALTVGMVTNLCIPYSVMAAGDYKEVTDEPVISDAVLKEMESGKSEIPVIIWRNSVSDKDIEGQVKEKIGFTINDLEEKYDLPSPELINELSKAAQGDAKEYLEVLMKSHMDLTAASRKKEKEKTDLYLKTRRECIAEYYTEKADEFIEKSGIEKSSIGFVSQYAPIVICSINPEEIIEISKMNEVETISLCPEIKQVDCSFPNTDMKEVMGVNEINSYLNLTGDGVDIGIYESGSVLPEYNFYELDMFKVQCILPMYDSGDSHATWCASVAAGNKGVAPNALIYSAANQFDWEDYNDNINKINITLSSFERLINSGVSLINISWGLICSDQSYNFWAQYTDELISQCKLTVVCATGNDGDNVILSPSSAYNCIAVNGFRKVNNDYVLCNYSYDNADCCLKPDVIAEVFGGEGTSTAHLLLQECSPYF